MRFLQLFSLPLLTKELIEQAQNRRTYVLRVIYAVALYVPALLAYRNISGGGMAAGLVNFGQGRALFEMLWRTQVWMIVLLLPPITCGALTVEKEKDTLALLLLTKLSPWTIVFEKFLSRIFAMGTYQLLSLPLFAIVYGIGGVELGGLVFAILSLMALTVVVGSISILCSTWFRTTSVAFVMTYLSLMLLSCFVGPIYYGVEYARMRASFRQRGAGFWTDVVLAMISSIVASPFMMAALPIVFSVGCLLVASKVLVPRAFVPARNLALELFQRADRFFNQLNKITTGGIVLVPDRESLPGFDPITWRETRKKSLGTFRYQFRILMLLLAPLIFAIVMVLTESRNDFTAPFRGFPAFFWVVSAICLTIHSTGAMPTERIRQTLDVLLVTPLTPSEIVLEKLSGVRRLIMILTVPFAVLVVFQAIWTGYVIKGSTVWRSADFWLELVTTSLAAIVYMPVIMWVGFQFGLRLRTQIQAVLSTFALIGATCAIPVLLTASWGDPSSINGQAESGLQFFIRSLNPLQIIFGDLVRGIDRSTNMQRSLVPRLAWPVVGMHFAFYGVLWWWLRRNALRSFSKIVRRMEPGDEVTIRQGDELAQVSFGHSNPT